MTRKKKAPKTYTDRYLRDRKYSIAEVRHLWEVARSSGVERLVLEGDISVTMQGDRYDNFFLHGTKCVSCGLEGKYFWLETPKSAKDRDNQWHFNLYGVDENGNERMLTKDHIVPKSRGGKNWIGNYQTMCERCNLLKGNSLQDTKRKKD